MRNLTVIQGDGRFNVLNQITQSRSKNDAAINLPHSSIPQVAHGLAQFFQYFHLYNLKAQVINSSFPNFARKG
jgi:hypothetical protein